MIAKVGAGQGAPQKDSDFTDNGILFIRAGHLEELLNGTNELNLPKVNEETAKFYKLKKYKPETVVFAKSGMSATKGRIYKLKNTCYVVSHLATLDLNDNANSDYIVYSLRYYSPTRLINDPAYPSIGLTEIENHRIPLPPLQDQIRIADILSRAEALIAKRKESIRLLDDLVKSVFLDMFGDPVRNEKGFVKLDKYINFLTSGSRGWAQYYSAEGALFLRIQNVGYAELRLKDIIKVNVPDSAEGRRTRVKHGDLLLSITADLGRTAVIPKYFEEAYINQHLALIRFNSELNPLFVAYYFSTESGQAQIQRFNRVGVKSGLNFQNIKDLEFPYFDVSLQNKFAAIVEKIEATKVKYRESLSELEALYVSLSQRAFRREL